MPGIWSGESRFKLRSYFDHADDFLTFCGENYSSVNLIKNLIFDLEKEDEIQRELDITSHRYKTLSTLLAHDFIDDIMPDKVIIYGAGVIGKELYKKIKTLTWVMCFVDREKAGEYFESVKIISPEEISYENGVKVIVSAAYDFKNIKEILLNKFQKEDIICLDDILNVKF